MKRSTCLTLFVALAPLAACSTAESAPLLFGQTTTFGVAAGAAPTGIPELVVGLKHDNVAVVPTVIPKDLQSGDPGQAVRITAHGGYRSKDMPGREDALSTYGSFGGGVSGGESRAVTAEIFFSTGIAAQYLAAGHPCALLSPDDPTECFRKAVQSVNSPSTN